MLDYFRVSLHFIVRLVVLKPGIALEAHQSTSVFHFDEQHHVTIRLFILVEAFLFHHLSVVHEADEFPLSQIDHLLRHILSQVNNYNLIILWRIRFVRQQRIIDNPSLLDWLLRIV